jgi:oligosaccharyltransferase complex subunit beta
MASYQRWLCAALLCLALLAHQTAAQKRVLALVSGQDVKQTHSKFFRGIRGLGFDVDIKQASDKDIKLKEYDTYLYDHLILFSPKTSGARPRGAGRSVPGTAQGRLGRAPSARDRA